MESYSVLYSILEQFSRYYCREYKMGTTSSASKTLTFHHGNAQQALVVFQGTPPETVLNLALQRLSLSNIATTRDIVLLNGDGTPVAFFPDVLPDGYHLYILVETTVARKVPKFRWSAEVNSHKKISYGLSECGTVLFTGEGSHETSHCMAVLCSEQFFTAEDGIIKWRYKWDVQGPYRSLGLLDEHDYNKIFTDDYCLDFSKFPLFQRTGQELYEMTGECVLDMTRRTYTISHDGGKSFIHRNIPDKVWIGVTVKRGNAVPFGIPDKRLLRLFFDDKYEDDSDSDL